MDVLVSQFVLSSIHRNDVANLEGCCRLQSLIVPVDRHCVERRVAAGQRIHDDEFFNLLTLEPIQNRQGE